MCKAPPALLGGWWVGRSAFCGRKAKPPMKTLAVVVVALLLSACGGRAEPTAVPVPTFTNTPETVPPTAVIEPTVEQPSRTEPVEIILIATETPIPHQIVEPTATPVPIIPTDTPSGPPCDCSGDSLNCGDFRGNEARACFDYCMATVGFDVHRLDADGDGRFCESNR